MALRLGLGHGLEHGRLEGQHRRQRAAPGFDLHEHVHKENNILFPAVLELERAVGGSTSR